MSVRDFMKRIDSRIYKSPIVRATASFGAASGVEGAFFMQPRTVEVQGSAYQHVGISFECQCHAEIATLKLHDPFHVDGYGCYRFLRELLPGGDESGRTIIELGERIDDT